MLDDRWRLFIALPVPDEVREALGADLEPYRRAFPHVRWPDPESWHLTLVFIGDAPAVAARDLEAACREVATAWSPFPLDLVAGGGRVQRGDGVAWLSVGTNARRVIGLAEDLRRAVRRGVSDIPEPRRTMSAHLTVARHADRPLVAALGAEAHGPLRAGWRADRIELIRSHLGRSGACYERLDESPLQGPSEP